MKTVLAIFSLVIFACLSYTEVEASVSQCYYCYYTCQNPLQIETCPSSTGYRCISGRAESGNEVEDVKGCVLAGGAEATCNDLDNAKGGSCRLCDTDLCNSAVTSSISVVLVSGLFVLLAKII